MSWLDLTIEIALEFCDIRFETRGADGFRFFRLPDSAEEVARVANWRKRNRRKRNETARALRARDVEGARSREQEWRERNREKVAAYKKAWRARRRLTVS